MLIEWSLGKSATWEHLLSVVDRVTCKMQSTCTVKPNNETNTTLNDFRIRGTL